MTTTVKFIGGRAAGRTQVFPDAPPFRYEVAVLPKHYFRPFWNPSETPDQLVAFDVEQYTLRDLRGGLDRFYVYAPEDWMMDRVLEELLDGYLEV